MGLDRKDLPDALREAIARAEGKQKAKTPATRAVNAKVRTINPATTRMNKYEGLYAAELAARTARGEVVFWMFEPFNLRLAENTYYRPDFVVVASDGTVEIHEVKGFWRDDARVKIKAIAEVFWPFVFRAVQIKAGHFIIETFNQSKP